MPPSPTTAGLPPIPKTIEGMHAALIALQQRMIDLGASGGEGGLVRGQGGAVVDALSAASVALAGERAPGQGVPPSQLFKGEDGAVAAKGFRPLGVISSLAALQNKVIYEGGGALHHLHTETVTGTPSAVDIQQIFDTTKFICYLVFITKLDTSANAALYLQFFNDNVIDGGASYHDSNYSRSSQGTVSHTAATSTNVMSLTSRTSPHLLGGGGDSTAAFNGVIEVYPNLVYSAYARSKSVHTTDNGNVANVDGAVRYFGGDTVDGFRLLPSIGTFQAGGIIQVYGMGWL